MSESAVCYVDTYSSPLGQITLSSDGTSLTGCWFEGQRHFGEILPSETLPAVREAKPLVVLADAKRWLDEYFAGREPAFLPCIAFPEQASAFQLKVWHSLLEIPWGTTCSYKDVAQRVGGTSYCRAAAAAVGRNPISLFVPCHRVIGSDGSLTGYAGGIERKAWLFALETGSLLATGGVP